MHYVNESPHGDRSTNVCVCMSVCLSGSTVAVLIEMYLKSS